jgi:hypothetical protein
MSSFVRFVLRYKKSDCAYGDVARDILEDEGIRRSWCFTTFSKHLEDHHNASEKVLNIIDELHALHKIHQSGLYKLKKNNS